MIEFSILGGASSFFCFALTLWVSFVGIGATHADIGPEKNRNTRVTANPRTILFTPDQTFAGNIDGFLIGVMVFIGLVVILNLLGSTGLYVYELIQLIGRCR
ncbi:MAG: hypothetical protein EOP83_08150 [Verrucomicrobiaceae bacterium]|nr:MAG: hypothetical protein EOP83_08150 [Verrucomicrobiaceae bacterium]